MPRPRHRIGLLERCVLGVVAALLRLIFLTARYRVEGEAALQQHLAAGGRVVLVTWHGRMLLAARPMVGYRATVMVSESRDGERATWLAERLGYAAVRGSSSHGGIRALLQLVRLVSGGAVAGHVLDGPRGPAEQVKPGVILLASRSRAAIVPVLASSGWCWTAPSWDRLRIPLPFAQIRVRLGEPLSVPPDLSEPEAEALRLELEKRMSEGHRQLDAEVAT